MVNMAFKDRLKQLRHDRGITQDMLADAIDVPPSTIRRYESSLGMPKHERLQAIANYFGCTIDYLLEREGLVKETGGGYDLTSRDIRLIEGFKKLSEAEQENVLWFLEKIKKE